MTGLIVTEWIEPSGGAERVLDSMGEAFGDAEIFCLWDDAPGRFAAGRVSESWLSRTPLRKHKAASLPLLDPTWRRVPVRDDLEWVLASSYVFAHHVRVPDPSVPKFVYAHSPARYLWDPESDERGRHALVRAASPLFRRIDRRRAQEATTIAANSRFVRDRIARAWQRDATVIHPPVAVDAIRAQSDWRTEVVDADERRILERLPETFIMGASRFTPYKALDRVIAAADRVGLPVVIVGRGPDEMRLRARAEEVGVPVEFVIGPSDALMYALMQQSAVFVFPPIEDFGIVPVEAQAAGTPVVTGPVGGQLEAIVPGVSGVIAASTEPGDLAAGVEAALRLDPFDSELLSERFGADRFARELRDFVHIR
ncbi:glycosyltransferase [Microbacterium sp. 22242]|uniref:glycosyltransferase n=1 Tax=Microbacterium sp. 22242 TaxID=3453896 RepID=UPI003F879D08